MQTRCPECGGTGTVGINKDRCLTCDGKGTVCIPKGSKMTPGELEVELFLVKVGNHGDKKAKARKRICDGGKVENVLRKRPQRQGFVHRTMHMR